MIYTVIVRPVPSGGFAAQVYGLPEIRSEANSEEAAIAQVRQLLEQWLATARLVSIAVPQGDRLDAANHSPKTFSEDDPEYKEYVEEIRRFRQEVDERACFNSSSTPIT